MIYIYMGFVLASTFLAYGLSLIKTKKLRLILASLISTSLFIHALYFVVLRFSLVNSVYLLISGLQIFNILRSVNLRYQKNTSKRVFISGLTLGFSCCLLLAFNLTQYINPYNLLSMIVFLIGVLGLLMIFKNTSKINDIHKILDENLPTVSVLIPARNEDSQLADCIESVIESDYPKLEIIVLDDCSQDNSSEIIKSFAQKGVRFIQGDIPRENWLAKNQAYETLSHSASGDWYLFMGVDVRLNKKTIRTLMNDVLDKKILMAGILPSFRNPNFKGIFYTLRFYWELVLPKFIMLHPPAVSTCWLMHDDALKSCGGFAAVSQSVLPERYFALEMQKKNKYLFYRNSEELGVSTNKTFKDQIETSQRLLYPQLRKSITRLFIMTVLSSLVIAQYALVATNLLNQNYSTALIMSLGIFPALITQFVVSYMQGNQYKIIRALFMPYLLVQELFCAYVSAYKYEFSEVIWKGRNVCYPSLKVIPKLPKI